MASEHQIPKSLVSLGDTFTLASGLLEITYDTGAKVILQGPVTYEVDSNNSGYLSLGKMTGRVEGDAAKNFAVQTPTATVVDLGTEFGVAVDRTGVTQVHVFQGLVEMTGHAVQGRVPRGQRLTEGQAMEIGRETGIFRSVSFAPKTFARRLQASTESVEENGYIQAVLADKPLGYWPLHELPGSNKFLDYSGNGLHGSAMNKLLTGQPGPLSGDSRSVEFGGNSHIDIGRQDELAITHSFTVEAWVHVTNFKQMSYGRVISADPEDPRDVGWSLGINGQYIPDNHMRPMAIVLAIYATKPYYLDISTEEFENHWIHLAVVFDDADVVSFYVDGKLRGTEAVMMPPKRGKPVFVSIGNGSGSYEHWLGRLAHVAIYPRALSERQINNHYQHKSESASTENDGQRR